MRPSRISGGERPRRGLDLPRPRRLMMDLVVPRCSNTSSGAMLVTTTSVPGCFCGERGHPENWAKEVPTRESAHGGISCPVVPAQHAVRATTWNLGPAQRRFKEAD